MEESKVLQYFEGKTILITGATGFLAKVLLEKILRLQPNVRKLFLLIRPDAERPIEQRLEDEIINTQLFRVLREARPTDLNSLISEKVIPVPGDVSQEDLGIVDSQLRDEMWREVDIIVNSAARTGYYDRYDVALKTNALGALHIQNFARSCLKLKIVLQVSTAYVYGTRVGLIPERALRMGETLAGSKIPYLDIDTEKKIIKERLKELQSQQATEKEITIIMKELGTERAKLHGWPNTYVFTKAMGEMLLENFKDKCKVIIIRPTIITSTYKEPFPGWIEGLRTIDSIFAPYGKGKLKFFVWDPESIADMIPGDMVVNCMLAAIAWHSNQPDPNLSVYHVGSSRRNPITYAEMKLLGIRYLTENPLHDEQGKPIIVRKLTTLKTMASFRNYIALHYLPFLMILKFLNMIFCNYFESEYARAKKRIDQALRLVELYKPYLFFQGIFDDVNSQNLQMTIRSNSDMDVLNFDPTCIKWEDYFLNTHFPGLCRYVLRDC